MENKQVITEKREIVTPIKLDASNRAGECPKCGQSVSKEEHNFCNICGVKFDWPEANF